jgi:UDP-2,4-diacetamido-2,4,6-trideoxy-beta-L-altropyranose hydrolase
VSKRIDIIQCRNVLSGSQSGADWLVVDHYSLDHEWEAAMRPFVDRVMVMDDLANRRHDCDLLLDQSYLGPDENRYMTLVPAGCERLLGPQYALLRPEFLTVRDRTGPRQASGVRVLISFGGSDSTNETGKALKAIKWLREDRLAVDVVIGPSNTHAESVRRACSEQPNWFVHFDVRNMAELLANADLAIGAGGTSTWERCCLGVPALIIAIAENQVETGVEIGRAGAAVYLGRREDVTARDIALGVTRLLSVPGELERIGRKGMSLVDARGADRVSRRLIEIACRGVAR